MKTNMGNVDRVIRVIIFVVMVTLLMLNVIEGTLGYVLMGISSVLLVTSLINFCPLYKIFGISTCKVK
jgi:hypothetical protein